MHLMIKYLFYIISDATAVLMALGKRSNLKTKHDLPNTKHPIPSAMLIEHPNIR
jgi:hypothetical protein